MNASSDMLTVLRTSAHDLHAIPDATVHAIITSPPYLSLRQYQGDQNVEWPAVTYRLNEWTEPITIDPWRGPLGLEPSPVAYIGHLILCLREWRRVLRDDGVCFVNLGDSFASSGGPEPVQTRNANRNGGTDTMNGGNSRKIAMGLKPKDLIGVPFMFAFAARADGWYLRSDIIWAKGVSFLASYAGSSMPESVTDRPSKSHEYVFLLTKSPRYFWDLEAVKEKGGDGSTRWGGATMDLATPKAFGGDSVIGQGANRTERTFEYTGTRNLRTVWVINPQPYKKAHYAVFPERLVEPMIKASTSERGCCSACGAPYKRVVKRIKHPERDMEAQRADSAASPGRADGHIPGPGGMVDTTTTLGWQPTCTCDAGEPVPATVLDPFSGSGTTARVAIRLGRHAIVSDISNEYLSDHVPGRTTVQMEML